MPHLCGPISFELVDASTKLPLFTKTDATGAAWFVAEAGQEWFLSFANTQHVAAFVVDIKLDGRVMPIAQPFSTISAKPAFLGAWDSQTGVNTPLRFAALEPGGGGGGGDMQGGSGGEVSFAVTELVDLGPRLAAFTGSSAQALRGGVAAAAGAKKGVLKAEVGSSANAMQTGSSARSYGSGRVLDEFR